MTPLTPLIVTHWEVEEFVEQMSVRTSLWFGKERLWIRRFQGENLYAVKFVNGLPRDMSTAHAKGLGQLSDEEARKRLERVLLEFTSYSERLRVRAILERKMPKPLAEMLSWEICNPSAVRTVR